MNIGIILNFTCGTNASHLIKTLKLPKGAKGDWDFRISDLVKNPNGTDI